jgi:hypothetical protein
MDLHRTAGGLSARVPAHTTASFTDLRGAATGTLYDVSRTGALLSTDSSARPGSKGMLRIKSYRSRTELSFNVQVARIAKFPDVGLGLIFTGMGLASMLWLNNYCAFYHERKRVVMIDTDTTALSTMERILTTEGFKFVGIDTVSRSEAALARIKPAMVMLDATMASSLVTRIRQRVGDTPVLLCTDATSPDLNGFALPSIGKKAARDEVVAAVRSIAMQVPRG